MHLIKRITASQLFAVVASYVAGSYAYTAVFALRMGEGNHFLLVIAPAWFAAHISVVILCTIAGREGWNMDNTLSFIAFVVAFTAVYCTLRIHNGGFRCYLNKSLEAMPPKDGAP